MKTYERFLLMLGVLLLFATVAGLISVGIDEALRRWPDRARGGLSLGIGVFLSHTILRTSRLEDRVRNDLRRLDEEPPQ